MALHHVAFATKDLEATHRFYEDLMGFSLVHAEGEARPPTDGRPAGWIKHVFYDIGDDECIAFFRIENMGEQADFQHRPEHLGGTAGVGEPRRGASHLREAGRCA